MPIYTFRAKKLNGEELTGTQEFASIEVLKAMLSDQGFFLIDAQIKGKEYSFGELLKRVDMKDISLFCRQFSVILNAGIPIVEAIAILRDQVEKKKFRDTLEDVHDQLQRGNLFSSTLQAHPKVFPDFMINMVEVGEASGTLDSIMISLAEYYEKENKLRRKIKSAMTYPMILLILMIGVVTLLMVKVLPTFSNILQSMGGELPALTKILMGMSDFMVQNVALIFAIVALGGIGLRVLSKNDEFRFWLDSLKLRAPVIKATVVKVITARFARSMGILLKSGIPIIRSFEIMNDLLGNRVVAHKFTECRDEVMEGKGISGSIKKMGVFPPMLIHMIEVGEATGQLDEMLTRTAGFFDEEVEEAIEKLTAMIEPAMIVIMAVVVGTVVMAMMLPMVSIMQSVQQ
ncbi:type II secretion system F family protein [Desulfosporosinus meridiei]|uniref:Type II secretory pathway, component PulF n=1 Tax=Desulfosporosinus meridiei (strain ATCC BAA-275 / DSM 13257 / KCTC 12902 / NCIMB 13706 / S10) TaxID=768704 RepID=J7IS34_DESMD|nr:type II secretion system F family protein [Desulfosporosinus meridiei]AFQ42999.1 type II secretory pathway, component PulF [Desulfosporosinus meridiei DSM 13257]